MNKIFRVKWNRVLNRFDVTSELARGKTKSSCGNCCENNNKLKITICSLIFAISTIFPESALSRVTIDNGAIVEYDSFNPPVNDSYTVAQSGNGTLNILDGQSLIDLSTGGDFVGNGDGSRGIVNISGGNSSWIAKSNFVVGNRGYGEINVSNGAMLDVDGGTWAFTIGSNAQSNGVLNIHDNGQFNVRNLFIGSGGNGEVNLFNNSQINFYYTPGKTSSLLLGAEVGSSGLLNIGSGSTVNMAAANISSHALSLIGGFGSGQITLSDGGVLNTGNFGLLFQLTNASTGFGRINIGAKSGEAAASPGVITGDSSIAFGSGDAKVVFNHTDNSDSGYLFNTLMTGSGGIENWEGHTTLTAKNTYTEETQIFGGTVTISQSGNIGPGALSVESAGTFNINHASNDSSGNYTLVNALRGGGLINVDLASPENEFNFYQDVGGSFNGVLKLNSATYSLNDVNTSSLNSSALIASKNSNVNVSDGVQSIDTLAMNGGRIRFNVDLPANNQSSGIIHVDNLYVGADALTQNGRDYDVDGTGIITVNIPDTWNDNAQQHPDTERNLLQQDDSNIGPQLIKANSVIGSGGNLVLEDQNGLQVGDTKSVGIAQHGEKIADATYGFRLTTAPGDGLYVNYGLKSLNILADKTLTLSENTGATGSDADMSAQITGDGNLAVEASGLVSLSNSLNDYKGKTDVRSGTLLMNSDNVLGQTSELALASATGFNMNGFSQTVRALNTETGSALALNGGTLTVSNGGTVNGSLQGSGAVNVGGGTLTVNGSNAALAVKTTIASSADVQLNNTLGLGGGNVVNNGLLAIKNATGNLLNDLSGSGETDIAQNSDVTLLGNNSQFSGQFSVENGSSLTTSRQHSLGSASISNEGTLNLASADSWQIDNSITGTGMLNQNGSGIVTLSQAAAGYTGDTNVNQGGLQLGSAGNDITLASKALNIAQGAVAGGFGGMAGDVNNSGTLMLGDLNPVAAAFAPSLFSVAGNLSNSGEVTVGRAGGAAGNLLDVKGNYVGTGGHLTLNTALGDDDSVTDKLVIEGDTSGTTKVSVNNAGGLGAKTVNGIEVIQVKGKSDGEFVQDGRIVAGAYDYSLARGKGADAGNWYLTNILNGGGDAGEEEGAAGNNDELIMVYRPESAAYSTNMAAANNLFNTRLHDRLGETHYVDALSGEVKATSMWLRSVGGDNRSRDSSGQIRTQTNRFVMQMGGDIAQWSSNSADRYHLGLMAGYGNAQSNSRNHLTGQEAGSTVSGYSTGIYGTWLQDNDDKTGAYVDSWMQYSWFNNSVKGDSLAAESYKSKGFTASVESGYAWKIGEKNHRESYYVQPQAQITWMGVKADEIRESNGTQVKGIGDGNIQTRLGARAFIKGHSAIEDGTERTFQPFIEANWIHNTKEFGSQLNGVTLTQIGTRNMGEIKVGVEGQIIKNVNLWGNIAQQMGDKGYSDTSALIGFKVSF